MISIFDLAAMLLTLSALFGWINRRFIHLPHAIGMLVMGLLASLILVLVEVAFPGRQIYEQLTRTMQQIDFTNVVMNGMLAFLLFAGALNLDLAALRDRAWPVAFLALAATVISTVIVGLGLWGAARAFGRPLDLAWAMVFGALISPTDPVAVLSTLRTVWVPETLRIEMEGEALFNDGVGVVLFTVLVGSATMGQGGVGAGFWHIMELLVYEAGGGLLLGAITGYVAYRAMRTVDDFPVEVLITLALVTGTYALAQNLGTSGPLSVVAAGLLIGDKAPRDAMSKQTENYITTLWTLVDEVLNSVLFLLIGLEVAVLRFQDAPLLLAATAVPIVLLARLIAVSTPLLLFRWLHRLSVRNIPFLTWAGIRGGISIALALSLPDVDAKSTILTATYAVVLFAVIVQGATLRGVVRLTLRQQESNP